MPYIIHYDFFIVSSASYFSSTFHHKEKEEYMGKFKPVKSAHWWRSSLTNFMKESSS